MVVIRNDLNTRDILLLEGTQSMTLCSLCQLERDYSHLFLQFNSVKGTWSAIRKHNGY